MASPGGYRAPRASLLGLDTLARRKRAAAALEFKSGSRKKFRLDDGDEPYFKGMVLSTHRTLVDSSSQSS